MKKTEPKSLEDILGNLRETTCLGKLLVQAKVWDHWEELVGASLAPHGEPMGFRDTTLVIAAESAVWMNLFAYKKLAIIQRINGLVGCELVTDVFVVHMDE